MSAQAVGTARARPRLRGWSHLGAVVPMCVATGVLVAAAKGNPGRQWALLVYGASATWLFLVSGLYHAGRWTEERRQLLRRIDHANIFVLVAGTYTPVTLTLLDGAWRITIISLVWGFALAGIALVVPSMRLPRALVAGCYLLQGWVALVALPKLAGTIGGGGLAMLLVAGGLYTVGALAYALRRPDPLPEWFGYHEVFHVLVLAANGVFFAFMCIEVVSH